MKIDALIEKKIREAFAPAVFELENDSHNHAGHAGDDGSGQTHFNLLVVSDCFEGQNRVERHRQVYAALEGVFELGLHALALAVYTPQEYQKKITP